MTPTNDSPAPSSPPLPVDDLPLLTEVVDTPSPAGTAPPPPAAAVAPAAEAQLRWIERRLPQILAEEMALLQTRVLTRLKLELEQGPPK